MNPTYQVSLRPTFAAPIHGRTVVLTETTDRDAAERLFRSCGGLAPHEHVVLSARVEPAARWVTLDRRF